MAYGATRLARFPGAEQRGNAISPPVKTINVDILTQFNYFKIKQLSYCPQEIRWTSLQT